MNIVIVPEDNRVSVDGEPRPVDLAPIDQRIHVVKWDDGPGAGTIEWKVFVPDADNGGRLTRQTAIDDFAPYQQYKNAWDVALLPPAPTTIVSAIARKDEEIFQYRKSLAVQGYLHTDGRTYDVDAGSASVLANVLVNVALGLPLPGSQGATMIFWDINGVGRSLDAASLTKLLQGLRNVLQLKFERYYEHKAAIRAIGADTSKTIAVRIAEIAAYDDTTGYPDQTWQGVGVTP